MVHKNIKPWISRMRKCDWFGNVGTGELKDVLRAASWKDVKKHLSSAAWDKMSLAVLNELHKTKADAGLSSDEWSDSFEALYDDLADVVDETILAVVKNKKLPESIVQSFKRRAMCLLLSLEFLGSDHQSFDRRLIELYLAGHCPCGYKGKYPGGKLIVY